MVSYNVTHAIKPKSQKGKRILEERAPQLVENPKRSLSIKGGRTSENTIHLMKDLYELRKPFGQALKFKNPIYPFEDDTFIENFGSKYDASLFTFVSHSKKRPDNFILGRQFDFHILDMIELGVENFKSMDSFKCPKVPVGSKPVLTFAGEQFDSDPTYKRIKNLFIDYFKLENVEQISLQHVQLAVCFAVVQGKIQMRVYKINLKKTGTKTPYADLVEIGPRADFSLRRHKLASDDLFKQATRQPDATKIKKVKNVSRDVFGSQLGRVHVGKQKLDRLQTRKMTALKKTRRSSKTSKGNNANMQPLGL